mgnify:CR=1 FL=1
MNYSPKVYAQSFCKAIISVKNDNEAQKRVDNFLSLIKHNRDKRKLKDILLIVEKINSQKKGYQRVLIETARKINEKNEKIIKKIIKSEDRVETKIDNRLIAGVRITIDDEIQFDGSLSKKLKNILDI